MALAPNRPVTLSDNTHWIGCVWGSTRGGVSLELHSHGNQATGTFSVDESGFGQFRAKLRGEWTAEGKLTGSLEQFDSTTSSDLPAAGQFEGDYDESRGVMTGAWKTETPAEGQFIIAKIDPAAATVSASHAAPKLQVMTTKASAPAPAMLPPLITKTVVLGSYRLDELALRQLSELVKDGTKIPVPIITAAVRGRQYIHVGVDSLVADPSVPAVIHDITVSINEFVAQVGNSVVTVTLTGNQINTLFVSGYDRIWVEGKASQIESFLQHHESKTTKFIRRYGSNVNAIIFLTMIGFLPSIPSLSDRFRVLALAFVLLTVLLQSWRVAKNTIVFLRGPQIVWYQRHAGWLLVLLEVALTGWVALLIQRYVHPH